MLGPDKQEPDDADRMIGNDPQMSLVKHDQTSPPGHTRLSCGACGDGGFRAESCHFGPALQALPSLGKQLARCGDVLAAGESDQPTCQPGAIPRSRELR